MTEHIINSSTGKDSTATLLLACEYGQKKGFQPQPVLADTGNEHEDVFEYMGYLEQKLDVKFRIVKADFTDKLARKKEQLETRWLPYLMTDRPGFWSPRSDVKMPVAIVWCEEANENIEVPYIPEEPATPINQAHPHVSRYHYWTAPYKGMTELEAMQVILKAKEVCEPTGIPFLDLCIWKGRFPSTKARFCTEFLKINPTQEQIVKPLLLDDLKVLQWVGIRRDESENRKDAKRWEMDPANPNDPAWIYRPIVDYSAKDVFALMRKHGILPNPLYFKGCRRVGCMPCIEVTKPELENIDRRFPMHIEKIEMWQEIASFCSRRGAASFFSHNKTPGVHRANKSLPTPGIKEVVEWSKTGRGGKQYDLITAVQAQEAPKCSSFYGLCE
jgi:3'-phosphoadenosine 5'-phosphosulfate sulfotransferase (PAPS reductase)/FAD synthetase